MSSFIISKKEYVKAAGLMYAIEVNGKYPYRGFLDNVYDKFVKFYLLNAQSVDEQYEEVTERDVNAYIDVFESYKQIGNKVIAERTVNEKRYFNMQNGLVEFFNSVLYQTENEKAHDEMAAYFYDCIAKMHPFDDFDEVGRWWGSVDI